MVRFYHDIKYDMCVVMVSSDRDISEGQSWCNVCPLKKGQGDKPLKLLTISSCVCVCERLNASKSLQSDN